ncbi:hypothetical protein IQ231_11900 [Cuspidothrix issatschenkoi LEGE 03284]|uniref:hypothetical protein n=1 Tax=Cuspidothrix issatschenkoi TaxID=230752 RepID=UPI00187EE7DA|nr:hypothetical protein [Cuspidothrix issatschenkoi]MBE9232365.1 hypothetical protein [Cuspidothrix issatschenkoi LEGE 03284]
MLLTESKTAQIINTYLNFCKDFNKHGKITHKNLNRILCLNAYLKGKKDDVRLEYGNLLDEIYCLLEKPEVISKIEEEKNKIKIPIKHENLDNCVLITQLETKSRELERLEVIKIIKQKPLEKIGTPPSNYNTKKTNNHQLKSGSSNNKQTKKHRKNKKSSKSSQKQKSSYSQTKSKKHKKQSAWKIRQFQMEEEMRNKERKIRTKKNEQNLSPNTFFDDSSIFEDIMDERRAEGKGYSGSK